MADIRDALVMNKGQLFTIGRKGLVIAWTRSMSSLPRSICDAVRWSCCQWDDPFQLTGPMTCDPSRAPYICFLHLVAFARRLPSDDRSK